MVDMGNMAADQRRDAIQRMLAVDGSVTQQSLAAALGVSQSQVQRDVAELRRRGVLSAGNFSGPGRPRGSVTKLPINSGPSPGEELVARLRAEMAVKNLEPDAREEGLLVQIRQVADEIAELRERIAAEGLTFKPATPGGPPRMHPAAAEIRQNRTVLARLLSQIQLEESVRDPVKARAAGVRWRAHNSAKALRYAEAGGG
jgi:DNA-binding Lrp family transcriptional regulator